MALSVGALVTTLVTRALATALVEQNEYIDSNIALLVLGLGLLMIGIIDWRMAGVEEPPQPWPRIRRAAKWSGVLALPAALVLAQPDESIDNREGMQMRGALERLADAESAYFAANRTYTTDISRLQATTDYYLSDSLVTVTQADGAGWVATAKSSFPSISRTCSMSLRREGGAVERDGPRCTR